MNDEQPQAPQAVQAAHAAIEIDEPYDWPYAPYNIWTDAALAAAMVAAVIVIVFFLGE